MHYLVTGHTGFKGSWLSTMLEMQGHSVSGIALDPQEESLFNQANISSLFTNDLRIDIRDRVQIQTAVSAINPDVIIHLAAQPLVRESYRTPLETFEINMLGTLNILEASRELSNLKAALIITTDKVYKNHNHLRGYIETDELGGDDPYSASKATADIAAQSWIKNFSTVPIAIARAGNVIGGGDWASDRLIPDLVKAYANGNYPTLRYPNAIRPWQHVLDCLNGYLTLVDAQLTRGISGVWNFGPDLSEKYSVNELVTFFASEWGVKGSPWIPEAVEQFHEAGYLLLDSEKSRSELIWENKLRFENAIRWTVNWYKANYAENALEITRNQIRDFFGLGIEGKVQR